MILRERANAVWRRTTSLLLASCVAFGACEAAETPGSGVRASTAAPPDGGVRRTARGAPREAGAGAWAGANDPLPATWWRDVGPRIAAEEYRVAPAGAGVNFVNRAQNLRGGLDAAGQLQLTPRVPGTANAEAAAGVALAGVGRADGERAVAPATPQLDECAPAAPRGVTAACLPRVRLDHGWLTQRFENGPDGLVHEIALPVRPPGAGDLALRFTLAGAVLDEPSGVRAAEIRAALPGGGTVPLAVLTAPEALDARARGLPCRIESAARGWRLRLADEGARYPLRVRFAWRGAGRAARALFDAPAWSTLGEHGSDQLGSAIAPAGDVNDDGYFDVLVGVPGYDGGEADEGACLLFLGGPSGLAATPGWRIEGDQPGAALGRSVAAAGDVNGDGVSDFLVGAPFFDAAEVDAGRVLAFYGSAEAPPPAPDWIADGRQAGERFGWSVAGAGDVEGDGIDDVLIGAPSFSEDHPEEGGASLYRGSTAGLAPTPAWFIQANQSRAHLGFAVTGAGDIDADGFSDVLVAAPDYDGGQPDEGRIALYRGSLAGLGSEEAFAAESDRAGVRFGAAVAAAGDVDGDGFADVLVGAPYYDEGSTDAGAAFLFTGSAAGLAASPLRSLYGEEEGAEFGASVASAGDIDGDGRADLLVGAPRHDAGGYDAGRAYVFVGAASAQVFVADGQQQGALFGCAVAGVGDVDGDGYGEVVVGARRTDLDAAAPDVGAAFAYSGSANGLNAAPEWQRAGEQAAGAFGFAVAAAGDVNADGFDDALVGAPRFDAGQVDEGAAFLFLGSAAGLLADAVWVGESDQAGAHFGHAVAGAGDVNGDGHADLLIGAPDMVEGEASEGLAFVYHGSPAGPSRDPDWFAEGDSPYAAFGAAVAGAGDVDGDGHADVLVGAPEAHLGEASEGRVCLFHGTPRGLAATPGWAIESNQTYADLGFAVAGAGDVNADGFGDVVVGARYFSAGQAREGRVLVFHGSVLGLDAAPDWVAEPDQPGANFGSAVAGAGDVNGDGFDDVLVGAPRFDAGLTDEGAAFLYAGSVGGLDAAPLWVASGGAPGARLGEAVSGAGDVDGDGFFDILVGAPNFPNLDPGAGQARLYGGAAGGPGGAPRWQVAGQQADERLGAAVAGAGDVNGDGFSDVLLGAPGHQGIAAAEGRALAFLGNAGGGLPLQPLQTTANGRWVIAPLGMSDAQGGIRFSLFAPPRSPVGRTAVKLIWEVQPLGVPFRGTQLGQSATWQQPWSGAGQRLSAFVTGLAADAPYHWRARLRYARGGSSPWVVFARRGGQTPDIRTPPTTDGELGRPCSGPELCLSGFCVNHVCCDVGTCHDAYDCSLDTCAPSGHCTHTLAPAGHLCRAAHDLCDLPEVCDGANWQCEADRFYPHNGDPNKDAVVTAGDALIAFTIARGAYSPTIQERCAVDCDGNGAVTAGDAQRIFLHAISAGPPCGEPE